LSTVRRVVSNTVLSLATDTVTKATRALVFIIVARQVGPVESGAFVVALSYQAIFQAFTLAGTDYLLIREVAKDRRSASEYLTHVTVMKAVLSVASWVVLLSFVGIIAPHSAGTVRLTLLLALAILPEGLGEVCRAIFIAYERLLYPTVVSGLVGAARLALSYVVLQQGAGVEAVAVVVVVTSWASVAANLAYILARLVRPTWQLHWAFYRRLLPDLGAFAGMGILRVLEFNVTILMLSYISGERQVGVYNAAYTVVLAVLMASQAYGSGAMPVLSRLYAQSRLDKLALFYRKSVQLILVPTVPLVLLLMFFAPSLVLGIYTPQFEETVPVLQVLSLVILFTLFTAPQACIMLAANLQRQVVAILVASIAVNVAFSLILIPGYGALGASASRVIASAATAVLYSTIVHVRVVRGGILQTITTVMLAGSCMTVCAWILRDGSLWQSLSASLGIYTVVAAALLFRTTLARHLAGLLHNTDGD
jgi:O-antigen/teichoic acid export membrane protein